MTPKSPDTSMDAWLTTLIWCVLMAPALVLRPLLPIDETRYITVAWEMWSNGNFMVPTLNGEIYSHKPPFLFWFMDLGWTLFGTSEVSARLVAPLFGLGSLWLTAKLARELWPDASEDVRACRAMMAPMMLVTGVYWAVFSTMTMFDMLVTFAAVLAVLGSVKAWKGFATGCGFWRGILIAGLGIGIGGLAKGPAILVHTLPLALAAPLWGPHTVHGRGQTAWKTWYLGVFFTVLVGVAITLMWAIPAAIIGGAEYRDAIFIKQSADRMVKSFAHRRPFYWFAVVLPLLLLPWTLWPRLWKGIGARAAWREHRGLRAAWCDGGVRVLLIWAGASFVIFSAISGKQPHYLLPVFPALALFAAFLLTHGDAQDRHASEHGHRVPVLFLGGLMLVLLVGLLGKDVLEPLLKKPLPAWSDAAQPLWLVPALILAASAALTRAHSPRAETRLIALTVASVMVFVHMSAAPALDLAYNLEPAARQVKAYQDQGRPVAYVGKYHGEFQFMGRLTQPLSTMRTLKDGQDWAKSNATGVVIATLRERDVPASPLPIYLQAYRGKVLVMWDAKTFKIPAQSQ